MALPTLNTDSIMTMEEGQAELDTTSTEELIRVLNGVTGKALASMGRVQLNEDLSSTITERIRQASAPTIYLHAPVNTSDFDTYEVTVRVYYAGVLSTTYLASDGDIIVTSSDYSSRVDLAGGCFPETVGANYIEIEYYGGWASIPGDVYSGAVTQARVDLKRLRGEAGMKSHSRSGKSVQYDSASVIKEVEGIWQPYRMII